MTGMYIQAAAALAFVILLIVAAGFAIRKKQNRFGLMSVVSYQPFGPKKGVAALKVGNEILILGVTQNDMRLFRVYKNNELDLNQSEGFQSTFDKIIHTGVQKR